MKFAKLFKEHIWTVVVVVFLAGSLFNQFGGGIIDGFKMGPYIAEVNECYEEAKSKTDKVVVGLDYACAINVAATVYEEDEDLAIAICSKFGILPQDDPIQISSCRYQIKKKMDK